MFRKFLGIALGLLTFLAGWHIATDQPGSLAAATLNSGHVKSATLVSIEEPLTILDPTDEPPTSYYSVELVIDSETCDASETRGVTMQTHNGLCDVLLDRSAWPYSYGLADLTGTTHSSSPTHMTVSLKKGFVGTLYLSSPEAIYLEQYPLPTEVQRWSFNYRPGFEWEGAGLNYQYLPHALRLLRERLSSI